MIFLPLLIVIPLAGAVLILVAGSSRRISLALGSAIVLAMIISAGLVASRSWGGEVMVHRLGNWPGGLGLGLAIDMLGGVMVLIISVVGGISPVSYTHLTLPTN